LDVTFIPYGICRRAQFDR